MRIHSLQDFKTFNPSELELKFKVLMIGDNLFYKSKNKEITYILVSLLMQIRELPDIEEFAYGKGKRSSHLSESFLSQCHFLICGYFGTYLDIRREIPCFVQGPAKWRI